MKIKESYSMDDFQYDYPKLKINYMSSLPKVELNVSKSNFD